MSRKFVHKLFSSEAIYALWLIGVAICGVAPGAAAQVANGAAIRVESNQVVVPVLVLDKRRVAELRNMNPSVFLGQLVSHYFVALKNITIPNLSARDFQVFEDGRELKIERVNDDELRNVPLRIRDNLGQYSEFVGVGGGTWITTQSSSNDVPNEIQLPDLPSYLIAYTPPPSPSGSCHIVSVKVDHPNSLVYARPEYCNTKNSAADPLAGTKLGKKLESDLASEKKGKIKLSVSTLAPLSGTGAVPVRVYLRFPSKPLSGEDCAESARETISIFGAVYAEKETLIARFSDLASKDPSADYTFGSIAAVLPVGVGPMLYCDEPSRYQTEILLPPGQYELRMVLRDGNKFGRATAHFAVASYDGKHLAMSGLALVRRFREAQPNSEDAENKIPGNYSALVTKRVEVTPTADTRFKKSDPFYFYFQVYEPQLTGLTVEAQLRIVNTNTGKVMKQIGPFNAEPYRIPGDPVIPIGGGINISNLPAGNYSLEAQATDSKGQSTVWQATNFTIE